MILSQRINGPCMTGLTHVLGTDDQGRDMLSAIFYACWTGYCGLRMA